MNCPVCGELMYQRTDGVKTSYFVCRDHSHSEYDSGVNDWIGKVEIFSDEPDHYVQHGRKVSIHGWHPGNTFDVLLGKSRYKNNTWTRSRVKILIRSKPSGRIMERIGDGRQVGNFYPIWINWGGQKITVEKLLAI